MSGENIAENYPKMPGDKSTDKSSEKKKKKGPVRIPVLIFFAAVIAVFVVFQIVFFEDILKAVLEKRLSAVNQAPVTVKTLAVRYNPAAISLEDVSFYKNRKKSERSFFFKQAAVSVDPFSLFTGKVRIERIAVTGFEKELSAHEKNGRSGGAGKEAGVGAGDGKADQNRSEREKEKSSDPEKSNDRKKAEAKEVEKTLFQNPVKNQTDDVSKKIKEAVAPVKNDAAQYSSDIEAFQTDTKKEISALRSDPFIEDMKEIKKIHIKSYQSINDISKARKDIKKITEMKKRAEKTVEKSKALKTNYLERISVLKREGERLKKQAVASSAGLSSSLGLGDFDKTARTLIGAEKYDTGKKISVTVKKVFDMLPSQKKGTPGEAEKNVKAEYNPGRVIWYNGEDGRPGFLIETINISGKIYDRRDGKDVRFSAAVKNISSDLSYAPVTIKAVGAFRGRGQKEGESLSMHGRIYKQQDHAVCELKASGKDIDINALEILNSPYVERASGDIGVRYKYSSTADMTFSLRADVLKYRFTLGDKGNSYGKRIVSALNESGPFYFLVKSVKQSGESTVSFKTDMTNRLKSIASDVAGRAVREKAAAFKKAYEDEIGKALAPVNRSLTDLTKSESDVTSYISDVQNSKELLNHKEKQIQTKIEALKKEKEEALKKEAASKIKENVPTDKIKKKVSPKNQKKIKKVTDKIKIPGF